MITMILDYFRESFGEIWHNKLEAGLTMLGIVVGIASVTLILSLGEGATQMIKDQVATYQPDVTLIAYSPEKTRAANALDAFGGASDNPLAGFISLIAQARDQGRQEKAGDWIVPFSILSAKYQIGLSPFTTSVNFFSRTTANIQFLDKSITTNINFIESGFLHYLKDSLVMGRLLSDGEIDSQTPVALVKMSIKDYQRTLSSGGIVGKLVTVEGYTFRIVGVVSGNEKPELYLPYTYFPFIATFEDQYQFLVKMVKGGENNQKTKELLGWINAIIPSGDNFIEGSNIGLFNEVLKYLPRFTQLMSFVAGISLIVGGIGIMNSMISSVIKRTREIGIRKSIGAKNTSVIIQFIIESVVIAGLGGLIGILLGVLTSTIILRLFKIPPVFPLLSIVYSVIFTLAIGIASGIAPAVKAAKLDPIEALGHS